MKIQIYEIENLFKELFTSAKVNSVNTVYEKNENSDNLKLIIFINRMLYDDINIFYTKFIFNTDKDKYILTKNSFKYLYDLNCEYKIVYFSDINNLKSKILSIIKKQDFGVNLKMLSKFSISPTFLINDWFYRNSIKNVSVKNIEILDTVKILPCEKLFFDFTITTINNEEIKLNISKTGNEDYIYTFNINGENISNPDKNLLGIVDIICSTLKNNLG